MSNLIDPEKIAMIFRKKSDTLMIQRLSEHAISVCDLYSIVIMNEDEFEEFHNKWNSYKSVTSIDLRTFYKTGQTGVENDRIIEEIQDIKTVIPALDDLVKVNNLELISTKNMRALFKTDNNFLILIDEERAKRTVCKYNLYVPRNEEKQAIQPVLYLEHANFLDEEFVNDMPDYLKTKHVSHNSDEPVKMVLKSCAMPIRSEHHKYGTLIESLYELREVNDFAENNSEDQTEDSQVNIGDIAV